MKYLSYILVGAAIAVLIMAFLYHKKSVIKPKPANIDTSTPSTGTQDVQQGGHPTAPPPSAHTGITNGMVIVHGK